MIGFPLLIIPFAIYNMIAFLTPGFDWASAPFKFPPRTPLPKTPFNDGSVLDADTSVWPVMSSITWA